MDKKYELLKDDCINYARITLYRIKALRNFGDVKAGDLGGYIESEKNLSHEGECWTYGNACIFDNAKVYEDAKVYENAKVFGSAKVYMNAEVFGNAQVFGDATIYDNAAIFGRAEIFNKAQIYNKAKVYGNAWVFNYAKVYNNAEIFGCTRIHNKAKVYGNAQVSDNAEILDDAKVCGNTKVFNNALIYRNAVIDNEHIIGRVSMSFKDIFQYQCKNRMLTAILTEDDKILYSIGCQENITEEEFIYRIHNKDGGLEENPHRAEYLRLIPLINIYFRGELKWTENMNY